MGLESFASKAYENNVAAPASSVAKAFTNEKNLLGKVPTALGEVGKEALFRMPLRNIGSISSWALRKMVGVLGNTVSLAGSAAMLVPLPVPGLKNGAQVRGSLAALSDSIRSSAQGNTVRFSDRLGTIGSSNAQGTDAAIAA